MATREQRLTQELLTEIVTRIHREKLGLYPAMRILGYALVAAAEALPLEGEADEAE